MIAAAAESEISNLSSEIGNQVIPLQLVGNVGKQEPTVSGPVPTAAPQKTRNARAIKAMFKGDYTGTRGVFLLIMDIDRKIVQRIQVVIASMAVKDEFRFSINQDWKGFEDSIIRLKLGGAVVHQMGMDVESYIKRVIEDDIAEHVCECIAAGNFQELRKTFVDIMSKAIADANVILELAVESIQTPLDPDEASLTEDSAESASTDASAAAGAAASRIPIQEIQLKVDPVLAPMHGVAAKELKAGISIIVQVKEQSTLKQNMSKLLAVNPSGAYGIDALAKGTVQASVTEVVPAAYDRVTILMSLAPNIVGVANIFGDLRIKIAIAEPSPVSSFFRSSAESDAVPAPRKSISRQMIVLASLGILWIMVLLAWFIFGVL